MTITPPTDSFPGGKPKTPSSEWRALLWLLLVLTIVAAIRIRLVNMPLERDEGEFAYGGQLFLQGTSLYQGAYNDALKLPGTCAAYALAMLFGQTTIAIHVAAILVTLATAIFVFLLSRHICGSGAGVVAAATYALLSISPRSDGLAAHATHFVMLPAMMGIFLLQKLDKQTTASRIFFAGLLLGLAVLMKQTGAAFGLFAALWIAHGESRSDEKNHRRLALRLGWLALGGLLPFLLTCALIALAGDWPRFWMWTFKYAGAHAHLVPLGQELESGAGVAMRLFMAAPTLWSLALIGLASLFYGPFLRPWRYFVLAFAFFSLVAVYPGWRSHYFIQLFPVLGLLAGLVFHLCSSILARLKLSFSPYIILLPIFGIAFISPLLQWRAIYFTLAPAQVPRAIYGANPYPESVEIGRYLALHCPPDGRIVVLGSEPEIYFYSHRRAATGYIDTYPLMEPQPYALAMQKEMIQEIEKAHPDYLVYVHVQTSCLQFPDSQTLIFDWFDKYQHRQLQLVGLVEIPSNGGPTAYSWYEGNVTNVQTTAQYWLAIFRKK